MPVAKALKEKPSVALKATGPLRKYYAVGGRYTVEVYGDLDDQYYIECGCLASSPPIDEATGLPSREAVPCYHAASVLIHIAEQEKENGI